MRLLSGMISALFVEAGGVYFRDGIDPWDEARDARLYRGPHPVVAHPPCARWGKFWSGGPSAPTRTRKGDDGGCFAAALWAVRTFGGVIEHPAGSLAWPWFGLESPGMIGWIGEDRYGGRCCCVEQGHYGHEARKATWLYGVSIDFRWLQWGPSDATRPLEKMSKRQRRATPEPFADLLMQMVAHLTLPDSDATLTAP